MKDKHKISDDLEIIPEPISNFCARVSTEIKDEFDKAIIDNKKNGHIRDTVIEHMLQFYTHNGLPSAEHISIDNE